MNDFLDNFSKVVNETAKRAIKVSGDVVELTKTSLNIKFDEIKKESFFKEIGKIIYNLYKISPESASDEILDFCKCIDEIEISINSQKSRAAGIKNKKFCVNCGTQLPKSVTYCYICGVKQPEIIEEEESENCCCCSSEENSENESKNCCADDCCADSDSSSESCECENDNEESKPDNQN